MKLTMLGTGNALVTEYYNTCFVLEEDGQYFLVDGGGGNGLLHQLRQAGMDWKQLRHIFVTHKHLDHVMGILWLIRLIGQYMRQGEYEGEAYIYAHAELVQLLLDMAHALLPEKETRFIGQRLHLVAVADGEARQIIGHRVQFFDIHSTKAKQYGFTLWLNSTDKLTCCGDEPYNECERPYAENSKWLLHEAFCLHGQADVFHPYEKHHSTVQDACQLAARLNVPNLVLYHTEDKTRPHRKALYLAEGKACYAGNLFVPDDLDTLEL